MEDMESIKTLKMEVSTTFDVAIEKRQLAADQRLARSVNIETLKQRDQNIKSGDFYYFFNGICIHVVPLIPTWIQCDRRLSMYLL